MTALGSMWHSYWLPIFSDYAINRKADVYLYFPLRRSRISLELQHTLLRDLALTHKQIVKRQMDIIRKYNLTQTPRFPGSYHLSLVMYSIISKQRRLAELWTLDTLQNAIKTNSIFGGQHLFPQRSSHMLGNHIILQNPCCAPGLNCV